MKKISLLLLFTLLTFTGAKSQQILDNGWPLQFKSGTIYRWVSNNWSEYLKLTPAYSNGKLQQITAKVNSGGNWVDAMKISLSYDSEGRIGTRTLQSFAGGEWKVGTIDSFFYENGNKPSTEISYQMDGGTLKRSNRNTYIYGGTGLLTEIFHQDVDPDGSWSNDDYMYYYYDSNNRLSSIIRKDWNGSRYVGKRNTTLNYSAAALEMLEQDTAGGAWNNGYKYVFDSAVIATPTAIKNVRGNALELSAYPNPVKNTLTVQLPVTAGTWQVMVTDVSGKVFLRKSLPTGSENAQLNVESLPSGVYILQFTNIQHTAVSRFVKE
ncbi:MAG: T9SS type A sorting domain-containing protein [Bacteroidia bacterium]